MYGRAGDEDLDEEELQKKREERREVSVAFSSRPVGHDGRESGSRVLLST